MLTTRTRAVLAASACSIVALTGAACGGSSTLSADEFRTKADEICKTFNDQNASEPTPNSPDQVVPYLERMIPKAQDELNKLKELNPPSDLKGEFDSAVSLQQQGLELITKVKDRIKGGEDPMKVFTEASPEINRLQDESKGKAEKLGLKECGKSRGDDSSTTATTATAPIDTSTTSTTFTSFTTPSTPTSPMDTSGIPTSTSAVPPVDTTSANPTGSVGIDVFANDAMEFGQTLQSFGTTMQSAAAGGLDGVRGKADEMRADLDKIDTISQRMAGYTVDDPTMERRRADLVAATPEVTAKGRELLAAAEAGDLNKMQQVASEFTSALSRLSSAATG